MLTKSAGLFPGTFKKDFYTACFKALLFSVYFTGVI
jgi:hypothetical protein